MNKQITKNHDIVRTDINGNAVLLEMKKHVFQASAVRKMTGISYKKLNDWDEKKFLPYQEKNEFGWRSFNGFDIICLKIIALLRDKGASLPELKKTYIWLKKDLRIKKIVKDSLTFDLFLCTDLEKGFVVIPEKEVDKFVNSINEQPYLVFRLNPIIQDYLRELKIKF